MIQSSLVRVRPWALARSRGVRHGGRRRIAHADVARRRTHGGWPSYGGGPEQIRYSSLTQINRSNVRQLEVAWTYDSGETGGLQTNPIVVDGVLFATTPKHRVVALDAATGAVRWTFDSGIEGRGPNRGVTYWSSGDDARIFTGQGSFVYALDARTGRAAARLRTRRTDRSA